jgi:hypothetical protein
MPIDRHISRRERTGPQRLCLIGRHKNASPSPLRDFSLVCVLGLCLLVPATTGCSSVAGNSLALPWAERETHAPKQTASSDPRVFPSRYTFAAGQLIIHADVPLEPYQPLFDGLKTLRADISRLFVLSSSNKLIDVYLFETQNRFENFVRSNHPELPNRRAFFVENKAGRAIYVQVSDRMETDLRHEATHAYLHMFLPDVPLWLDEGLAKYFESPANQHGLNPSMLVRCRERLRSENWQPNLRRLEEFPPTYSMTLDDYAEAWAWVYFLMESEPKYQDLLKTHIKRLVRGCATPREETSRSPEPERDKLSLSMQLAREENNIESVLKTYISSLPAVQ